MYCPTNHGLCDTVLVKKMLDELAVTSSAPPEMHDALAFQISVLWFLQIGALQFELLVTNSSNLYTVSYTV